MMLSTKKTVSVTHKSIHVVELDNGKFTVHVYVNGKIDAGYASGTREWADELSKRLADNDCPRCQHKTPSGEVKQVSAAT